MKKLIIIPAILLVGCSSPDRHITEQSELYQISMTQYQDYNCNQVRAEMRRLSNLIDQQTVSMQETPKEEGNQYLDTAVKVFAIARGARVNNQQPANLGKQAVLRRMRSQYNNLDQLAIQKDCMSN